MQRNLIIILTPKGEYLWNVNQSLNKCQRLFGQQLLSTNRLIREDLILNYQVSIYVVCTQ